MNRKGFISIIIVITLALIGLMIIQSYWIRSAITVKEANFIRDVNEAISGVISRLERIEAANEFTNQMNMMQQRQKWLQTLDSLDQSYRNGNGNFTNSSDINRLLNKSMIMHDVLENMFFDYRNVPIEKRINIPVLDSLIGSELKRRGIGTLYEFGIFSPGRNFMPVQKTGKYPKELLNQGFHFALFPSDMFNNPDYLMVFFPNEKRFIITQLWGVMADSALTPNRLTRVRRGARETESKTGSCKPA